MHRAATITFCTLLTACGTLPDVPEPSKTVDATDTYPPFVPIAEISMLHAPLQEEQDLKVEDTLAARVAGLQARADGLRRAKVE